MIRKKKLVFILITMVILTTATSKLALSQKNSDYKNENLFLLTQRTNEEVDIDIRTIIDESNNFHLFVRTFYENHSFAIFHVVNDEINFIILEDLGEEIFEVFSTPDGVFLFYGHSTYLGLSKFYMYHWTPQGITNEEIISHNQITSRMYDPTPYFFYNETASCFDLIMVYFVTENPLSEIAQTKFRHYQIFPNFELNQLANWIIDFEFDYLINVDYHNGTVYAFYRYMQQLNPNHVYKTVVTKEYVEYESNNMTISEGGFTPEFYVSNDGTLNTLLFRDGKLFYLSYSINETISFDMFNITDIGINDYNEFYVYKYEDSQSYILGSDPYIEYPDFFTNKEFKSKIVKLNHKKDNITIENFYLENIPENSKYHSFHILNPNDESSRILTHSSLLDQEDYKVKQSPIDDFIGFLTTSNYSISIRESPLLYNLDVYSNLLLFWRNVGIYLVCIIGILGISYLIFRKSINNFLIQIKNYLLKPSKSDTSGLSRVFVNIWNFLVNSVTTIYILFKTNKKNTWNM